MSPELRQAEPGFLHSLSPPCSAGPSGTSASGTVRGAVAGLCVCVCVRACSSKRGRREVEGRRGQGWILRAVSQKRGNTGKAQGSHLLMGHIRTPAPGLWLLSSRRKEPSVFALPSAEPCNTSERPVPKGGPPLGTGGGGGLSLTAVRERPLILPAQPENKGPQLSLTGLLSHTHHGVQGPVGPPARRPADDR